MPLYARFFATVALAALGLSVSGCGVARAQSGRATEASTDSSSGLQRQATATLEEMSGQSEVHLAQFGLLGTTIRRQLEKARSDRDVVRELCLSDKLSQVDVALRSVKERKAALSRAIERGHSELANHELQILSVYRTRGERIRTEADSCVGSSDGIPGEFNITNTVDPSIPEEQAGPWALSRSFLLPFRRIPSAPAVIREARDGRHDNRHAGPRPTPWPAHASPR